MVATTRFKFKRINTHAHVRAKALLDGNLVVVRAATGFASLQNAFFHGLHVYVVVAGKKSYILVVNYAPQ